MDLRSDLAFILSDSPGSVTVVCGSESGPAILREASKVTEVAEGRLEVQGVERALIFDPVTRPSLQKGSTLTAGAASFRVLRPVTLREDGSALALLVSAP